MTDITELLGKSRAGDADAANDVYALLYPELRRIAHSRLRHGGNRVSLDTTALAQLEAIEPRMARVVEMRYFAALSDAEIADGLGVT